MRQGKSRGSVELLDVRRLFTNIVITGTSGSDDIELQLDATGVFVNASVNGVVTQYSAVRSIQVSGGSGNDYIGVGQSGDPNYHGSITVPETLNGDGGVDTVEGGQGVDVVNGGTGDDRVFDDGVNSTLNGDAGNDYVHPFDSGTVYVYGGTGQDAVYGTVRNGSGVTYNLFQNDSSNTADGSPDTLWVYSSDPALHYTTHISIADGDSVQEDI